MNYDTELAKASLYAWALASYDDRYYVFTCVCDKDIAGRNKSELLSNFSYHFKTCPKR